MSPAELTQKQAANKQVHLKTEDEHFGHRGKYLTSACLKDSRVRGKMCLPRKTFSVPPMLTSSINFLFSCNHKNETNGVMQEIIREMGKRTK